MIAGGWIHCMVVVLILPVKNEFVWHVHDVIWRFWSMRWQWQKNYFSVSVWSFATQVIKAKDSVLYKVINTFWLASVEVTCRTYCSPWSLQWMNESMKITQSRIVLQRGKIQYIQYKQIFTNDETYNGISKSLKCSIIGNFFPLLCHRVPPAHPSLVAMVPQHIGRAPSGARVLVWSTLGWPPEVVYGQQGRGHLLSAAWKSHALRGRRPADHGKHLWRLQINRRLGGM